VNYKKIHGDCKVPKVYEQNPPLGHWVGTQRHQFKKGKLDPERGRMLEEMGFTWDFHQEAWEEMLLELEEYKEANGDCDVPCIYEANPQLGIWVSTQRETLKKGKLNPERKRKLEKLGFTWDSYEQAWEAMLLQLEGFKEANRDFDVPQIYAKNPQLAIWVNSQRDALKKGKLNSERERKLEDLGFSWKPFEEAWEDTLLELKKYKEVNGDCDVPWLYVKNPRLGGWVNHQRKQLNKGKLDPRRKRLLTDLGFTSKTLEESWEDMLLELKEYKEAKGNCLVPSRYEKNPQLGIWVGSQRKRLKKGKMSFNRRRKLEELGFTWEVHEQAWEAMLLEIKKFKEANINCDSPKLDAENPQLGIWVTRQRYLLKKGRLLPERKRMLTELGLI
jgi:dsDNA-binding SOS-regulon protein